MLERTSAAPPPVASPQALTAQWCSAALGVEVEHVVATPVGTGQMGACFRLELSGSQDLPRSVLAKLPTSDAASREFLHGSYATEVAFYRDIQPTVSVNVPTAFYAEISDDPAERGVFTLLLQDLKDTRQGDQIGGCTFSQALTAVRNLAALHGPRWSDPTLTEHEGLHLPSQSDADMTDALLPGAITETIDRLKGRLLPTDLETLEAVAPHGGSWSLAHPERFALVHGDYRLDNLMFHDDGRLWAVDWQTLALGLPARDLAFFVSTGLDVAVRREHEERLVAAYFEQLLDFGVRGYSERQCWEDYKFALLQPILIAVFGCAYSSVRTDRGDEMFTTIIKRGGQAIRDHLTIEVLSALGR